MAREEIKAVSVDEARRFWEQQEDARIFLHPDVLGPLCDRIDWWQASWNGNPVCLWPICHAFDGSLRPPALSSYVGPLWHDIVGSNKAHRWWTITRTVQQAFLELFAGTYADIQFELPPGSADVRMFQWFREEHAETMTLEIACRHTAIIRASGVDFAGGVIAGLSRGRRKDLIRAGKNPPLAWADPGDEALYLLYEGLLDGKSKIEAAQCRRGELVALLGVARSGFGTVLAYQDQDGNAVGFSLSLRSRKTASFVVLAVADSVRASGVSAWLNMEGIMVNSRQGAVVFDFLGANSRIGADEKHRLGGWPEMYFRISMAAR